MKDFSAARRDRNSWVVENSPYNYLFSPNSRIFHTRDCKLVLSSSSDVRGTMKYKTCIEKKRKPCKICNPVPPENTKQTDIVVRRRPNQSERRALKRLKEAQAERKASKSISGMSGQKYTDMKILTHPGFAFWAAVGYEKFHLRHCSRLGSASNLKGFESVTFVDNLTRILGLRIPTHRGI